MKNLICVLLIIVFCINSSKAEVEDQSILDNYMQQARAKSELGKYKEAIEDYKLVLKSKPSYSKRNEAYAERGKLYLKLKNYRLALSDFEQAEAISKKSVNHKDIAEAKLAIGDEKGASEAIKKAEEEKHSNDVEKLLAKFRAYKYGEWEKALAKDKNFFNEYLSSIEQLIEAGVNEDEIVSDIEEIKRFTLDIRSFAK